MWYLILIVLFVPLYVALIRTAAMKARPKVKYTPDITADEIKRAEEKLGAMIRVPTVSKHEHEDLSDFYRYHAELERLFPLLHKHLEKTVLNGTLLYRWKGSDETLLPVLFMGHQDVVPASDEGWSVPAYSGTVKDGCLYGRGALDCKGTMYVQMQAVEELLADGFVPKCDVYLEYSINEETGGDGAAAAMRYLRDKGIRFAFVLDEGGAVIEEAVPGMDRPYAVLGFTEKGYMDVKITARGKGGHSTTPPRKTPAARLYAFAGEIERKRPFKKVISSEVKQMFKQMAPSLPFGMRLLLGNIWLFEPLLKAVMPMVSPFGEALMATTCCFTQMKGSDAANVIPKEPYLIANLRCSAHQNCEESLKVLKKYGKKYGLEFEVLLQRDASAVSDIHSEAYKFVENTIRDHFPDVGTAPYLIMGGTDCRHFHALSDTALRFCPVRMNDAQNASCHAVDENVTVAALAEGVLFYKRLLLTYPGEKK